MVQHLHLDQRPGVTPTAIQQIYQTVVYIGLQTDA